MFRRVLRALAARRVLRLGGWLAAGGLSLLLQGCATAPLQGQAPERFIPLAQDPRVWHEPDGLAYAKEVSGLLDQAISRVEAVHGLPFQRTPRVYVCPTMDCFRALVPTPGYTAAVIPGEILALSPRLDLEENGRLPGILVHELSHLHLGQYRGHYTFQLPVWFHEGLASLVAEGGGAEFSSDVEACASWEDGRRVDFTQLDGPGKRHRAGDFKLSIHQFYRQSWRFTEYLQRQSPAAFDVLLREVFSGTDFTQAVTSAYNSNLDWLSQAFDFDSRALLPPKR